MGWREKLNLYGVGGGGGEETISAIDMENSN